MQHNASMDTQVERLLDHLLKGDSTCYAKFKEALDETNHKHVVEILEDEETRQEQYQSAGTYKVLSLVRIACATT